MEIFLLLKQVFAPVAELGKMRQSLHCFTPCCKLPAKNTSKTFLYPMFIKLWEALVARPWQYHAQPQRSAIKQAGFAQPGLPAQSTCRRCCHRPKRLQGTVWEMLRGLLRL